ncbi:DUF2214 domain-containing protein [Cellvibrio sp. UBA7671]|uniref:DUF2214 domain-containing protein n=1 Tax=Cellvibrio sp. UBA7671 TaxID=1946312 RepID=UPI002F34F811
MKTLIIYAHLLAACVAIGILLIQDLAIIRSRGAPLSKGAINELIKSARIVSVALVFLWVSGALLVVLGYFENPQQYLLNQKLWAKFTVVLILTINGVFLHYYSFPRVTGTHGLLNLSVVEQVLVTLSGAVSSVSWLFACYLGIARPWNDTVDFSYIMSIYMSILIVAIIFSCELLRFLRREELPLLTDRIQLGTIRSIERKTK